jgi:hypothetical protein
MTIDGSTGQVIAKLGCTAGGLFCLVVGVIALFKGLQADGEMDFSALARGKLKTGSAGVILLVIGAVLLCCVVMKGYEGTTVAIAGGPGSGPTTRVASTLPSDPKPNDSFRWDGKIERLSDTKKIKIP